MTDSLKRDLICNPPMPAHRSLCAELESRPWGYHGGELSTVSSDGLKAGPKEKPSFNTVAMAPSDRPAPTIRDLMPRRQRNML